MLPFHVQMYQSVTEDWITVLHMRAALIQLVASSAPVILASLAMVLIAQVRNLFKQTCGRHGTRLLFYVYSMLDFCKYVLTFAF